MAFTPQDSAIRVTPEIAKAVETAATPEIIKAIMAQAALDQNLVHRDALNPSLLIPTPLADNAPRRLAKTLVINRQKHILESSDEAGLLRAESDLLARLMSDEPAEPARTEQPRNDRGQFVSAEDGADIAARTELELKFKRGEITTDEYLTQSGAVERHLESQGISPDALREVSGRQFENSWRAASDAFLASSEGADWVGGDENMKLVARLAEENGLSDKPSAETIAAIWAHMKQHNLVAENPELNRQREVLDALENATDFESLKTAARRYATGQ